LHVVYIKNPNLYKLLKLTFLDIVITSETLIAMVRIY